MDRLLSALVAIVGGVGAIVIYFYGSNLLLDFAIRDARTAAGDFVSRERVREQIRPWLFIGPAILILTVYIVYPAVQTAIFTFVDREGEVFVGFDNYARAGRDPLFWQAVQNNSLWLIVVPSLSTVFGLLIAVLADRIAWGNIAKSLIFMPMAISFVGASVIWKFVYELDPRIGLLNAVLGFLKIDPVNVLRLEFWNSFFLMIILVWVQTGFAMVLLGAALRGVPEESLEAARIDGANEIAVFFRIMVPQILSTIFVVWTTISITVLKVFDIVAGMTNGTLGTQVMANYMYDNLFKAFDTGYSSLLAFVLMIAVVPIMVLNIRRFQQEDSRR
ncbi:MAG: carbohydrate ABC transporter permease [Phototrophicaceae bacterium]|jgi:alpha-glucoside transport system permease protein